MSTNQESADFFIARTFHAVRNWPVHEQIKYLAGLLAIVGDDPVVNPLRSHLHTLTAADLQAELFANGQARLNLDAE